MGMDNIRFEFFERAKRANARRQRESKIVAVINKFRDESEGRLKNRTLRRSQLFLRGLFLHREYRDIMTYRCEHVRGIPHDARDAIHCGGKVSLKIAILMGMISILYLRSRLVMGFRGTAKVLAQAGLGFVTQGNGCRP